MTIPRVPEESQERMCFGYEHAQLVDASLAHKLWTPKRKFRIDRVWYNNPTGLAAHAANFAVIAIKRDDGSPAIGFKWSTETGQEGTLTADTPVELTKVTDGECVIAPGEHVLFAIDENGTTTIPAGRVMVEGSYVD